jgi:carbamoyl-phosphate synthase small subunit
MNAVICTDGTSVDDLKLAFYRKFLTWKVLNCFKVSSTIPYFYGDENSKYKIAATVKIYRNFS